MTGDELVGEGNRLARPCVYLVSSDSLGANIAAIWGGNGIVPPPDGPYKHWLTVDSSAFPASVGQMPGVLSIYSNQDDYESGKVAISQSSSLQIDETGGLVLYARPALSLPPIDAVFKFGSLSVRNWLADNDWLPGEGEDETEYAYNDNFPDKAIVDVYEKTWQEQLPLFTGHAHAVLGGWHMPWPDGDWYELLDETLIAWTFADAEPWIEVWRDANQHYDVLQRIT